ncbi:unnamed protein product, partial [Oikopleura dioica]
MNAFATFGALNDSQSSKKQQCFESELIDHISGSVLDSPTDQENVDPAGSQLGSQTKKELDQ